jgi:transcriptional regulator with XRE-family HTH domain/Zn-dependent peptidase ImmA (M78 family)
MTVGERIKQARKANNLSLRELAERAEISPMAISKYERGQDIPSSGVLLRLAQALGVPVDFFFRPQTATIELQAYRKHASLGVKEQEAIQMQIQEWLERYLAVESLFINGVNTYCGNELPKHTIRSIDDAENAANELRRVWNLGDDPIENLTQLLEDRGIKVGIVSGFEHFDAETLLADGAPVIVSKAELPGDRQRFNLAHELGHLIMDPAEGVDVERACHRFAGGLLVPAVTVRCELGAHRSMLDMSELYLLKQKYGLSMQAWIFRAKDLQIIPENTAVSLYKHFRSNGWNRVEPGQAIPSEKPGRMNQLIYRALAEDLVSRSRAQELLGGPLQPQWIAEASQQNDSSIGSGN